MAAVSFELTNTVQGKQILRHTDTPFPYCQQNATKYHINKNIYFSVHSSSWPGLVFLVIIHFKTPIVEVYFFLFSAKLAHEAEWEARAW